MTISSDGTTKNVQIASGGTSYFNGGNVGIGTTSPTSILTVDGKTTFNADGDSTFFIEDAGTNAVYLRAAASDEIYFGANNTWQMRFQTTGNVTMDNGGNFGIGTASPNYKLSVANTSTRIVSINYQDSINTIMSHAGSPNYGLESLTIRGCNITCDLVKLFEKFFSDIYEPQVIYTNNKF